MNINYEYYRTLYYVVQCGSFTRAAEILLTNQPNVTHTIRRLEEELGTKLFLRSNRGVKLTAEGERLYTHVRVAIERLQQGEEELSCLKSPDGALLSISTSEVALRAYLLPFLREYRSRYPGVRLKLYNHLTHQAMGAVRDGQCELGFVTTPVGDLSRLSVAELSLIREAAIVGPALKSLSERTLTMEELLQYSLISLGRETMTWRLYSDWFMEHHLEYHPDIEAATADQILPMVQNDLGIGFVPEGFLEKMPENVYRLTIREAMPERRVCIIQREGALLYPAAKKLKELCVTRLIK